MICPWGHRESTYYRRTNETLCDECSFPFGDIAINEAFGVEQVDEIKDGESVMTFQTNSDSWMLFRSWYCMKAFKTYEEMKTHNRKWHKTGDYMLGCEPLGFNTDFTPECEY